MARPPGRAGIEEQFAREIRHKRAVKHGSGRRQDRADRPRKCDWPKILKSPGSLIRN
jgi:hypothetical protein